MEDGEPGGRQGPVSGQGAPSRAGPVSRAMPQSTPQIAESQAAARYPPVLQQDPSIPEEQPPTALSMTGMAGMLPDYRTNPSYPPPTQGRAQPGPPPTLHMYQQQPQGAQFTSQGAHGHPNPNWNSAYPQPYGNQFGPPSPSTSAAPGSQGFYQPFQQAPGPPMSYGPTHPVYQDPNWVQPASNPYYYPQVGYPAGTAAASTRSGPAYPGSYPTRPAGPARPSSHSPRRPDNPYPGRGVPSAPHDFGSGGPYASGPRGPNTRPGMLPEARQSSSSSLSPIPSVPRGPPRKPKQSGHALWVGNLPPGTYVIDLKDHFSRDATNDIESVFLISKSNCAFVNYRTENACVSAMSRFHDSRFQGVRLVCRLRRRSSTTPSGAPSLPGTTTLPGVESTSAPSSSQGEDGKPVEDVAEDSKTGPDSSGSKLKERYFVLKSLTVEDLEMSVKNGIWATQAHNEKALNAAFESAENVYLIFSANKSGEYFGYARMASAITEDSSLELEWKPKAVEPGNTDLPKAIPTPATEFAPKGKIIDDSARGTIFWEAESDELDTEIEASETAMSDNSDDGEDESNFSKAWGKPFKIEWISSNRLPFYRTRGLRNAWNSNREVKIARDGTQLETGVGQRLLQLFNRPTLNVGRGAPATYGSSMHGSGSH